MSDIPSDQTPVPTPEPTVKKRAVRKKKTTVDDAAEPAVAEPTPAPRKRVVKRKTTEAAPTPDATVEKKTARRAPVKSAKPADAPAATTADAPAEAPEKPKRGRPRKQAVTETPAPAAEEAAAPEAPLKPKRGRPRKVTPAAENAPSPEAASAPQTPAPAEEPAEETPAPAEQKKPRVIRQRVDHRAAQRPNAAGKAADEKPAEAQESGKQDQKPNGDKQKQRFDKQKRNNNSKNRNNRNNEQFNNKNRKNNQGNNGGGNNNAPRVLGPPEPVDGLLEITPKGFGFLRVQANDYDAFAESVYVPQEMIRKFGLRHAVWIHGQACRHDRGILLTEIASVNGVPAEGARKFPHFDELKAVNPNKRISFETTSTRYTTRTLDLIAPIGRGQRGLIVSPPRAGKTTLLQHMAEAIQQNYKDSIHLMILLVDERPEEVTEFKRSLPGAEIYASSNDGRVREHCRMAELCIERAKRLVEGGKHVFLLMDSITRLARAYNNMDKGSGRTMSGGIDARALETPRRLFAAARNTRQAGSLTIIATALIETNSRMDDLIFQEFKGTGNMELVLNRRIAEQYLFPAVDVLKSGTRREELIMPETWLYKMNLIRRALAGYKPVEAMERFLFFLNKYPSNAQMLLDLKQKG